MSTPPTTADEIQAAIADALDRHDTAAVVDLLEALTVLDADVAATVTARIEANR